MSRMYSAVSDDCRTANASFRKVPEDDEEDEDEKKDDEDEEAEEEGYSEWKKGIPNGRRVFRMKIPRLGKVIIRLDSSRLLRWLTELDHSSP
jgi:hypothetical protein